MDQLEIVCKQFQEQNNESVLKSIFNKLKDLAKSDKHHKDPDDWDVPFEKILICQSDFQRCGSQGDVFYGKISNHPVAVKRVKDSSLTDIRYLKDLNHINILKFLGISQNSSYHYIIMEWCPYGTLHDHIHSGRQLSAKILGDFINQIAYGMKYLHSKNIVHRDLKPSNILLSHGDILKISDFGAHRLIKDNSPITSTNFFGTPAYMAPEVIRCESQSFPVDVWSYGVVLWEILLAVEPYKNFDSSAVVWAVANKALTLPVPSDFPTGFKRILDGCWVFQPEKRLSFNDICIILKGAIFDLQNISLGMWLNSQATWRRDVRAHLNKDAEENPLRQLKEHILVEALNLSKGRDRNNRLYMELKLASLYLEKERAKLEEQKND